MPLRSATNMAPTPLSSWLTVMKSVFGTEPSTRLGRSAASLPRFLDDEVQSVASDVQGLLQYDGKPPSKANVKNCVLLRARQEQTKIGIDSGEVKMIPWDEVKALLLAQEHTQHES